MVKVLEENYIKIELTNTESVVDNIYRYNNLRKEKEYSNKSSTATYFVTTIDEKGNKAKQYLKCDQKPFKCDIEKTRICTEQLSQILESIDRAEFNGSLRSFFESKSYFQNTPNGELDLGYATYYCDGHNRYNFQFDNRAENVIKFRGAIIAILCDLVIEIKNDYNLIYPVLKEDMNTNKEEEIKMKNNFNKIFLKNDEIIDILRILKRKKNIILQGPPGVGKTYIAKNILKEPNIVFEKGFEKVITVQFHQSYSYEDFVQGFRPNDEGKIIRKDGIFYNLVKEALINENQNKNYCIIIDEINRGNLSKIFGELMLLIENDKRKEEYAAKLTYSKEGEPSFYVPENIYIIGTMNTADRSLAMVDYALRRRFAFIEIEPQFSSEKFKNKLKEEGINQEFIDTLSRQFEKLNEEIISKELSKGFEIGHSYFVNSLDASNLKATYNEIIKYEIMPLLREYWPEDIESEHANEIYNKYLKQLGE